MTNKKIIAVVGATGAQGGGLIRAIVNDPDGTFAARALTRDPNSDKAKTLADLGVEIVQTDVDDVDSLKRAFAGAYGAYCVTFFWEHFSPDKEKAQARNLAEAAKAAGLQHVIWSTLEDTRKWVPLDDDRMPTLQGKYKVPHFDAKGEADAYFRELGVPTTFLLASFYWENMIYFGQGPQRGENGTLALNLPMGDSRLTGIASADIGKAALAIFKGGEKYIGEAIGLAGDDPTVEEMAAVLSKVLGEEVRYNPISAETYRGFGFPGADDMGNMYQFYDEFEDQVRGSRDPEATRRLDPSIQTFEQWAEANKDRMPIQ